MISNRNGYLFQMVIFQFFADLFSRTFPKDQKCLFMVCNYMDKILTSSMHAENLRILPAFSKLCRKIDYRCVKQVMKQLAGKIHTDAPTIYGDTTWGELLDSVKSAPNKVIHSLEDPVAKEPGLKIMRGNISPAGAIVRPTAEVKYIKGAAKVYECDQDAYRAIMAGEIVAGDILVIRYEGCKGAPGMKELMLSIDALIGLGLDKKVGLITDARFSGFNYGAIVGHVSPEAYDGGVIALIENGDEIEMDIAGGTVNLLVSDEILAERRKSWVRPPLKQQKGVLNIYAQNCRPAEEGGAMQPWALDADYGYHHE